MTGRAHHFETLRFGGSATAGVLRALRNGARRRCPRCGRGRVFIGYAAVAPACPDCGLDLTPFRADATPHYFTVLIVALLIMPAIVILEQVDHPPTWLHLALWIPLTLVLTFCLLPSVKGAVIGARWALRIRD